MPNDNPIGPYDHLSGSELNDGAGATVGTPPPLSWECENSDPMDAVVAPPVAPTTAPHPRLTPEEREAIRRRAEAATPGPWWIEQQRHEQAGEKGYRAWLLKYRWNDVPTWLAESSCHEDAADNFAFIAAARSDVPRLLDALDAAEARATVAEDACRWVPVVERMPPTTENVLTFNGFGARIIMAYGDGDWIYESGISLAEANKSRRTLVGWDFKIAPVVITHWMPLPPGPVDAAGEVGDGPSGRETPLTATERKVFGDRIA